MDDIVSILNKDGEEVQNFGIMPDGEVCGQEITKKTLNDVCHQLISHPEKIEKRAEKPLKIILL